MAQYSQRSQPMHRHSKWLSRTFGDLGNCSSKIRTVCEKHVDPIFIRILQQRNLFCGKWVKHRDDNSTPYSSVIEARTSGIPKPGPSGIPKPGPSGSMPSPSGASAGPSSATNSSTSRANPVDPSRAELAGPSGIKPEPSNAYVSQHNDPKLLKDCKIEILDDEDELPSTNVAMPQPNAVPPPNTGSFASLSNIVPSLNIAKLAITQPSVIEEAIETLYVVPVPAKRARLDLQQNQPDTTSSPDITSELIIKDEPNRFESVILPSVIYQADAPTVEGDMNTEIENLVFEIKEEVDEITEETASSNVPIQKDFESIEEILDDLIKNKLITDSEKTELLGYGVQLEQLKASDTIKQTSVTAALKFKNFAVSLYLFSHRAYKYVIAQYNTSLPKYPAIREWLIQKGQSGFSRESLEAIYMKESKRFTPRTCVCIVLKDIPMSTMANTYVNPRHHRKVNVRSAVVMLAVAINGSWKLPIAYFWTNNVKGSSRGNLVRDAIALLEKTGAQPVAVSFELNDDNSEMLAELGCSLGTDMRTSFLSENGKRIFIFPEPYGVLEIISKSIFQEVYEDGFGSLVSLTEHLPLILKHCRHMRFLQRTTSLVMIIKALDFYNKLEDFQEAKGTARFLKHIHDVLDVLSSRKSGQGLKKPITIGNSDPLSNPAIAVLQEAGKYFKGIRMKRPSQLGHPLCLSPEGAGLLGLCALIDSAIMLMVTYSAELTVEFGKFIGNPAYFLANLSPQGMNRQARSALAFAREYRVMLRHAVSADPLQGQGKNVAIENMILLTCNSGIERINLSTRIPNGAIKWNVTNDLVKLLDYEHTEYEDTVVWLIARFVAFCLATRLKCDACIGAVLSKSTVRWDFPYDYEEYETRKIGKILPRKLSDASGDTVKICKLAEANFLRALKISGGEALNPKFSLIFLVTKVMKKYVGRPLFESLKRHQFDTDRTCNHVVELGRAVAEVYLDTRIKHYQQKRERRARRNKYKQLTKTTST